MLALAAFCPLPLASRGPYSGSYSGPLIGLETSEKDESGWGLVDYFLGCSLSSGSSCILHVDNPKTAGLEIT